MKTGRIISSLLVFIVSSYIFYSCGTMWGGSTYKARFRVVDSKNVGIYYNEKYLGNDVVDINISRKEADNVNIVLKKTGYKDYKYSFTRKVARLGPSIGVVTEMINIGLTFTTGEFILPIPLGTIIDYASGGIYKPDHKNDPLIYKVNYDNFDYTLSYPYDTNYVDSIYNKVEVESMVRDSIQKIKNKEAMIKDSLKVSSDKIRRMILSDTLLIVNFYNNNSIGLNLDKYVLEYPHEYFPNYESYLKVLIPEMDKILYNPMIDSTFQSYFERIYSYANKNGNGPMSYNVYKYQNDVVEYKGIQMQRYKDEKLAGFVKIGTWIYYYESGKIKEIINYNISGKKHGLDVLYNEEGQVIEYEKYINGLQEGI